MPNGLRYLPWEAGEWPPGVAPDLGPRPPAGEAAPPGLRMPPRSTAPTAPTAPLGGLASRVPPWALRLAGLARPGLRALPYVGVPLTVASLVAAFPELLMPPGEARGKEAAAARKQLVERLEQPYQARPAAAPSPAVAPQPVPDERVLKVMLSASARDYYGIGHVVPLLDKLVAKESSWNPKAIALANWPNAKSFAKELEKKFGLREGAVTIYEGPEYGKGLSVGLFQINLAGLPTSSREVLEELMGLPKNGFDVNNAELRDRAIALLAQPQNNIDAGLRHIHNERAKALEVAGVTETQALTRALRPWDAFRQNQRDMLALVTEKPAEVAGAAKQPTAAEQLEAARRLAMAENAPAMARLLWDIQQGLTPHLETAMTWMAGERQRQMSGAVQMLQSMAQAAQEQRERIAMAGRVMPGMEYYPGMEPGGALSRITAAAPLIRAPQVQITEPGYISEVLGQPVSPALAALTAQPISAEAAMAQAAQAGAPYAPSVPEYLQEYIRQALAAGLGEGAAGPGLAAGPEIGGEAVLR